MELWLDLLFGNDIGLFSVVTVLVTFLIIAYLLIWFIYKSGHNE